MFNKKRVYLDFASSTPIDERVLKYMRKFDHKLGGNPSALHAEGRYAKKILEDSRKSIATLMNAKADEIIFTSGGTESNNLAIIGAFNFLMPLFSERNKKPHIIVSVTEHKSVLEPIAALEKMGAEITYITPDKSGVINPKDIAKALREETILVSIMYANNEIGAIMPVTEIAKTIRRAKKQMNFIVTDGPYFHTDACQAMQLCDMDTQKLQADLMTLHSPKVYGPAGIGALYVKRGRKISPLILGGKQEKGIRSGRELPLLALGFAKAFEIASVQRDREGARLKKLSDFFLHEILKICPKASINGSIESRLPNNINVCIPGIDAEFAVIQLDERGIACSHASTCMNAAADSYSYVVKAIRPHDVCETSSLRFSLGRSTTKSDIKFCLKALSSILLSQWNSSTNSK